MPRENSLVVLPDGKLVARGRVQPVHDPLTAPSAESVSDAVADLVARLIERCPDGWHVQHVSVKKDKTYQPASERSRYFVQAFFAEAFFREEPPPAGILRPGGPS